jgi:hypothetical protein
VQPVNGVIEMRFTSTPDHDAMIQAIEVIPEDGTKEARR